MAKAKVVHSKDACTIILKGNPANPEPTLASIKFAGGSVEVSRCSDGTYYAHIDLDDDSEIVASRIDYAYEQAREHGIPDIPDEDYIKHIAVRVNGTYKEAGE